MDVKRAQALADRIAEAARQIVSPTPSKRLTPIRPTLHVETTAETP